MNIVYNFVNLEVINPEEHKYFNKNKKCEDLFCEPCENLCALCGKKNKTKCSLKKI